MTIFLIEVFTSLLNSGDDQSFTLYGSALGTDDYNNLTKRDYDWLYDNEWRIENAEILSKSIFSVEVTMKNYKNLMMNYLPTAVHHLKHMRIKKDEIVYYLLYC